MKRFLSVDWDYFINATAEERLILFPDGGNENLPEFIRNYVWDNRYRDPRLEEIEVDSPAFKYLLAFCRNFRGQCMVTDSHKYAFDFIMDRTHPDETFEVYNIDFHHDLYDYPSGDERVNCGNWVTVLREERPNMKYIWIKRDDSDMMTVGDKKVEAETMTLKVFQLLFRQGVERKFDYLFMCRSAMWSPPHLDQYFVRAVKSLMSWQYLQLSPMIYEKGISKPRPYDKPTDFSEYLALSSLATSFREKSGI